MLCFCYSYTPSPANRYIIPWYYPRQLHQNTHRGSIYHYSPLTESTALSTKAQFDQPFSERHKDDTPTVYIPSMYRQSPYHYPTTHHPYTTFIPLLKVPFLSIPLSLFKIHPHTRYCISTFSPFGTKKVLMAIYMAFNGAPGHTAKEIYG